MSKTIDQRVVSMEFDNHQFERNVATSMSTLDKLKSSLQLKGVSNGLENLQSASQGIRDEFGELEITATRAGFHLSDVWEKVTRKFENKWAESIQKVHGLLTKAFSSLTFDAMKAGFSEYETQMGAVQTILANTQSKGKTLDDVNAALDELNTYADKTIYNFTEMTRNIGTFTAAGVDLDTSVASIKGIANLAAVSGSTSQQASTAMYQLSQAMASGTVKLMDWNSVVNAGMGGQIFQDALKETAKVHGIAIDDIIKKQGSFRESLSEGWLTTEILTETLSKFTGDLSADQLKSMGYTEEQIKGILELGKTANDAATKVKTFTQLFDTLKEAAQSGWSQTWEIIIGDFEEAKKFLTEVSDTLGEIIGKSAESRNNLLEDWKALGGRDDLIESLRNAFQGLMNIIKPISDAWKNVFPPTTAKQLLAFSRGLKSVTQGFKEFGEKYGTQLERTLTGVFSIVRIVVEVLKGLFKVIGSLLGAGGDLIGGILEITACIGDMLTAFSEIILSSGVIQGVFKIIAKVVKIVVSVLGELFGAIGKSFKLGPLKSFQGALEKIGKKLNDVADSADGFGARIIDAFKSAGEAIAASPIFQLFKKIGSALGSFFKGIGAAFSSFFDNTLDWISGSSFADVIEFFNSIIAGGLGVSLIKLIDTFNEGVGGVKDIKEAITGLVDSFKDMIEPLTDCLKSLQKQVKANIIKTIATSLLILAAALLIISFIPKDKLYDALAAIGGLFLGLMGALNVANKGFAKIASLGKTFQDIKATLQYSGVITKIAAALLIAAIALKILGTMEWNEIERGLVAMGGTMIILLGALYVLSKISSTKSMATKGAGQLAKLALVMVLVALPLKILGSMSWETIGRGLAGMAGALTAMVGALVVMSKIRVTIKDGEKNVSSMAKQATQLAIMAAALLIISIPIQKLGNMPWENWARGLSGVIIALGVMVAAMAVMSKVKANGSAIKGATSMVIMASAFLIITSPLMLLSALNWEALARGLVGLIGVLGIMTLIQASLNKFGSGSVKGVTGLVIMASAFLIIVKPFMLLSALNWVALARGMTGLIGLLGTMLGAQVLLSKFGSGSVKGVTGLVIMASAFLIIVEPLMLLSALNWGALAKAGVALIGILGVLVGAQLLLNNFGSTSVAGAAGLLIMVAAINLLVPALLLLGIIPGALIAKSLLIVASAFLVLGGAALLLGPIAPIILMLSTSLLNLGVAMLAIAAASILFGIGLGAISAGLIALVAAIEIIAGSIGVFANVMVQLIAAFITGIIKGIGEGIVALCEVIAAGAPAIGEAVIAVVLAVLDMLVEIVPALAEALFKILVGVLEYCAVYIGPLCEALLDIVIGVINALAEKIGPLVDAVVDLLFSFIQSVISSLANMQSTDGLAEALLSCSMLTAIVAELAAIALLTPLAMAGVVSLGLVVGELSLLLSALGAIAQIPGLQWLISEGGNFLQTVGNAIGKFVGGIIGGIGEGIASSLPNIADDLSDFMKRLQPFIDGAKSIDQSAVEGVKSLVELILSITGAHVLESITSWLTGESSVSAFATDLVALGLGLKAFSVAVTGINIESVNAAVAAARSIATMAETIPNTGGIIAWFAGDNSMAKFASELPVLGLGLRAFSMAVTGINIEATTAAATAAKSLADMVATIPNTGGMIAWFSGDNSVTNFAADMPKLGKGLKAFSTAVAGINPEAITAAAQSAKSLADMVSVIPAAGGIASWFAGEQSISKFAGELPKLGKGLAGFGTSVKNINPESVSAAALAAKGLAEMVSVIPKEGGIAAWFSGEQSMSKFAGELPKLGTGISDFAKNLGKLNPDSVKAGAEAGKTLAQMTETIPTNVNKIKTFGDKLEGFGKNLKEYFKVMAGVSDESVSSASKAIEQIEKIAKIDSSKIKSVAKAIEDFTDAVKDLAKDVKSDLKSAGKEAIDAFVKGINDKLPDAKKACTSLVTDCADKIKEKKTSFETAGKNCADGFANGISANAFKAEAKAAAMAEAALKAAKEALDEHSPSKEFYKIARFGVLGFTNAFADGEDSSYNAGFDIANYAKKGLSEAMTKVTSLMGDMDALQPTIRPVLDLSDVRSNAGSIGNILGLNNSIGVMANVNALSSSMRGYSQNGGNYEVISAIDKLRAELGNVGGTTYNVGGITYDDGSNVAEAVKSLVRAARVERRV